MTHIALGLFVALWIFDLITIIIASVQASNGRSFGYPLALSFVD